ncbi:GNAT family N-acetyltransferase [Enterococcus timonensis]|uniref:GNAT family N-acetyltransferase n=1 Tax=Enterococcus timonensis TaxID=1852364 RepID=UPI0008DB0819|nr:GNAT family N-acetyltransferase [Enterococcus timonensis]
MIIRIAQLSDTKYIQKVNNEELHYNYSLEKTKEKVELLLSLNWQVIYVAEIDGEFAGYIQAQQYIGTFADLFVNIMGLAVLSKHQGHGVGKALMVKSEQWAKEIGAVGIRLNSGAKRTEAHKFYEKIGYEKSKYQAKFQKIFTEV